MRDGRARGRGLRLRSSTSSSGSGAPASRKSPQSEAGLKFYAGLYLTSKVSPGKYIGQAEFGNPGATSGGTNEDFALGKLDLAKAATVTQISPLRARRRIKRWLDPSDVQATRLTCRRSLRFVPRRLLNAKNWATADTTDQIIPTMMKSVMQGANFTATVDNANTQPQDVLNTGSKS